MKIKFCIFITLALCSTLNSFSTDKKKVSVTSTYAKKAKSTSSNSSSHSPLTVGSVEIQAADANDYYSSLTGSELVQLLGKNVNNASVQRVIKSMKSDYELSNNSGTIIYFWRNEGFAFKFNNKSVLQQISFYSATEVSGAFCSAFQSALPYGLSFSSSRNKIEEILGTPTEISSPIADEKFYAKYFQATENQELFITYNSNSNVEMNCTIVELSVSNAEKNHNNFSSIASENSQIENKSTIETKNINSENQSKTNLKNAIDFIGKHRNDAGFVQFLSEHTTKEIEIIDYEQSSQFINKKEGFVLNYDNNSILASVIFVNSTQYLGETYSQYQGRLPDGINFSLNMQEVEDRLGKPIQVSNNSETKYWEMYSINNGNDAMIITFDTNNSTIKNALISDIRVEKLK